MLTFLWSRSGTTALLAPFLCSGSGLRPSSPLFLILDVDLADEVAITAIAGLGDDAERQVLGKAGECALEVGHGLLETRDLAMRGRAEEEIVEIDVEERAPRVLDLPVIAAGPDQPVLIGLAADF